MRAGVETVSNFKNQTSEAGDKEMLYLLAAECQQLKELVRFRPRQQGSSK